ncbi:hypothetical protein SAY86_016403 [Trapa natans]|uniref:LOB domain-containing protein n=1 Tax=Trapa natans TaxID=22666 RepID=A0AAN7LK59_TRANT|nr:hypothetical protein SAY86_016403 [Trapa natans]
MVLIQQECVIPVLFTVSRQYKPTRDATRGLMTLKRSSSNACAACKYQRRKCTPECQLAQYFPSDKPGVFKNAHRLFGVKNILNILKSIHDPAQKTDAMTSIIYQANLREMFPVRGCCHLIDSYYAQIQLLEEELHAVHSQLDFYRTRRHNQVSRASASSTHKQRLHTMDECVSQVIPN